MTAPEYRTDPAPANRAPPALLVFGLGYTGAAIAALAARSGLAVVATSRAPERLRAPAGVRLVRFDEAGDALLHVSHVLQTAAPTEAGDPALARFESALRSAPRLRWAGMLSTTGVYGDRGGGWVDESSAPMPGNERSRRRVEAEAAWAAAFPECAVDLFRLAGIYGPGRSPFEELRAGRARRIAQAGHCFGRIHRDDIAASVVAAMLQERGPGLRVLNLADDEPAERSAVLEEAARLLGMAPPPMVSLQEAMASMSPMARTFWAEDRKVASTGTKAALGLSWRYPTFREGLRAVLDEERAEGAAQEGEV